MNIGPSVNPIGSKIKENRHFLGNITVLAEGFKRVGISISASI